MRIVIEADPALQLLRYADDGGEARVQPAGIDVGTLAPGRRAHVRRSTGTVASPIADRSAIRLRARLENDQTPAIALGQLELSSARARASPRPAHSWRIRPASRCAPAARATSRS